MAVMHLRAASAPFAGPIILDYVAFDDPHTIDVDSAGNLYVVEVFNNRLEKFIPREPADKSRLIGTKLF